MKHYHHSIPDAHPTITSRNWGMEARPYGMQRLLSRAVWDTDGVRDDLRCYALEQLGTDANAIAVLERSVAFPNEEKSPPGSKNSIAE